MTQRGQRYELIQLIAVAVSILETMDFGEADSRVFDDLSPEAIPGTGLPRNRSIYEDIARERAEQDSKWGPQAHKEIAWAMILAEEIGEYARELDLNAEDMTEEEIGIAAGVISLLKQAEDGARRWLNGHEWNARQQEVYDAEVALSEAGDTGPPQPEVA